MNELLDEAARGCRSETQPKSLYTMIIFIAHGDILEGGTG
jgi:hypothetical protein